MNLQGGELPELLRPKRWMGDFPSAPPLRSSHIPRRALTQRKSLLADRPPLNGLGNVLATDGAFPLITFNFLSAKTSCHLPLVASTSLRLCALARLSAEDVDDGINEPVDCCRPSDGRVLREAKAQACEGDIVEVPSRSHSDIDTVLPHPEEGADVETVEPRLDFEAIVGKEETGTVLAAKSSWVLERNHKGPPRLRNARKTWSLRRAGLSGSRNVGALLHDLIAEATLMRCIAEGSVESVTSRSTTIATITYASPQRSLYELVAAQGTAITRSI